MRPDRLVPEGFRLPYRYAGVAHIAGTFYIYFHAGYDSAAITLAYPRNMMPRYLADMFTDDILSELERIGAQIGGDGHV